MICASEALSISSSIELNSPFNPVINVSREETRVCLAKLKDWLVEQLL